MPFVLNSDKANWTLGDGYKLVWVINVINRIDHFVPTYNGTELTLGNCTCLFSCCPQPGAGIITKNAFVGDDRKWHIYLEAVPSGDCMFGFFALLVWDSNSNWNW